MGASNSFDADFIKEISVENNILQGIIFFPSLNKSLAIEIDPETDSADFADLINALQQLTNYLAPENLIKLQESIAKEITESAYEQEDYKPVKSDFTALEQDLSLVKIIAFPDGFSLDYNAKKIYPGDLIKVQLDPAFNIDDVAIYD